MTPQTNAAKEAVAAATHLLLRFDGLCEPNPGGVAIAAWILEDGTGKRLASEGKVVANGRRATNNYAEYCGLGLGLRFLVDCGWKGQCLSVRGDSKLVVCQVKDQWKCRAENLRALRNKVWQLLGVLGVSTEGDGGCLLEWVPREQNEEADALAKFTYLRHVGRPAPERVKRK